MERILTRRLESLATSAERLASGFDRASGAGGGASMSARMALEVALMEAEPWPYPFSAKQMDRFATRDWDWVSSSYLA